MRLNLLKVLNENFRIKIFITFALLIFFISVSFTSFFIHRQTKNLTDALIEKGNLLAGVLAFNSRIGVFSENKELLDVAAEGILQQEGVLEVSIFNLEGKLLKSKERPQIRTLEKSIRRDEKSRRKAIEEIMETVSPCCFVGSSAVEFWSPVISDSDPYEETSLFFKEDLLRRKSKIIGFAMITGDKRTLDKEINDLLVKTIFIGITFLIIGFVITYRVVKGITKPLNKLIESVKIFGTVGTVEKFPIETEDEIGKLAMAFNNMAESLKKREGALRESEERYRTLFTQASEGIFILSVDGKLVDVNESSARMHGYSTQEIRHMSLKDSDTPETFQLVPERMRRVLDGEAMTFEVKHYHKDGHVFPLEVSVSLISYNGESYVQCVHRDITERKQADEKIQASLREKEVLLGEIHHRVKNNLQVISGLLDFQRASSRNPELTEMLHESQRRIRSMALVHEKLYASKDFSRIELAGYVRGLSQELFQAYRINPVEIDLVIQIGDDVYVDINKAIPCGLILNELISNALKHAFPGDGTGAITISIRKSDDNEVEIGVGDTGLGLPDDVDIHQPNSVGLHLVNGLVTKQLDGQIEVSRDNGTEFRIKFPL